MSKTERVTIPFESLDPLTIGSCDDLSLVYREQIEIDIPSDNLLAVIEPDEPASLPNVTEAAAEALENPQSGPRFSEMIGPDKSLAIIIDNQFRPTPASKILPAILDAVEKHGVKDAHVVCANGKVFTMSDSDTEKKLGKENMARMERLGIPFFQNEPREENMYTFIGVTSRGTPVWLHKEVAKSDVKLSVGQTQSNHWGAGGGGKLILPGVVSDETIESNHCAFVMSPDTHYGSYAGPMRADIDDAATMCELTATLNSVINTRGGVSYMNFGRHPEAHLEALKVFNDIYAYERPAGELADIAICGVFAPTDHLFFHTGWGCMSSDLVLKDGATIIYCSPSPGVNTHLGNFPGLALMDLMKPYMPPTPENMERVYRDIHARKIEMWAGCIWVPIYEVMTRKKLHVVTLEENLEMAADIGIEASTSLENALASAFNEHGKDAKVVVLPYARYQMPRDAIVMPGQEKPQFAAVAE